MAGHGEKDAGKAWRSGLTDSDTMGPETSSSASSASRGGADEENAAGASEGPEGCRETAVSVLHTAPGTHKMGPLLYSNLTPWVVKLFFLHTYYAYISVFYLVVLFFFKGYALEYPQWRWWFEMVLIMTIPVMQHIRFFFGHWGCELGMIYDLCIFVLLSGLVMLVIMYFLFMQAYIMPLESTFLFISVMVVAIEGVCGAMNILQTTKLQPSSVTQSLLMVVSVLVLIMAVTLFLLRELLPREVMVEEVKWDPDWQGFPPGAGDWQSLPPAARRQHILAPPAVAPPLTR